MEYELKNGTIRQTVPITLEQAVYALNRQARLRNLTTGEMATVEMKCTANPSKYAAPAIVDYLRELWSKA